MYVNDRTDCAFVIHTHMHTHTVIHTHTRESVSCWEKASFVLLSRVYHNFLHLLELGVEVKLVLSYQSLQLLKLIVQNGIIELQTRHLVAQQHEGNGVRG